MIGILGAMKIEIDSLKEKLSDLEEIKCGRFAFYKGSYLNKEVVVVQCGIGLVAAAAATAVMIKMFSPSVVINIGVAGGVRKEQKPLDVIISKDVVQYNMDTTAFGDPLGYISGLKTVRINASEKYSALLLQAAGQSATFGTVTSGDAFVDKKEIIDFLVSEFNSVACDMESAAVGHTCSLLETEFCVLRSISDNGGYEDYNMFVKDAAENSIGIVLKFLEQL